MAQGLRSEPADGIIADPRWFPVDIDKETGGFRLAAVGDTRPGWAHYFEKSDHAAGEVVLSAAEVFRIASAKQDPPRLNFIWHTAYCCSTAITRALDVPGSSLTLQEPRVMTSAARARRECDQAGRGDISWLSDAVFRLMARPPVDGAAITVKPAPAANYLVGDALSKTSGRMLFLYSDCDQYLMAAMRHDESRRRYVRRLFGILAKENGDNRWSADAVARLTDLEVAGLVWMLQMEKFAQQMKHCGPRAASLDCALFLARPMEVLGRLWRFFDLPGRVEDSDAVRDGDFFSRHLTYPEEKFSLDSRSAAMNALPPRYRAQIEETAAASMALLPQGALPLPNPLLTVENSAA